ncbi:MAG: hypothetical protein EBY09_02315 [Verrucomicrobia bacterium]|nr:hypothetical protein [Verrucomicrobiota bacterium]NBU08661.1 hypothetical protein [Pseudomonadota bacterium]NDA65464.1 hypothetical protein [Verrucomicrobiota bacterium]NDD38279.1 hypothetical protein [Verrucomicrobiota bacterium]NDE98085.1 hypothetical protein [Verrucomicrobiota bacterium]
MNPRQKPLVIAAAVLVGIWALAFGGYVIARNAKVTSEKVRAYLAKTDLAKLQGSARAKALKKLADDLNQLSPEERRNARMDREWAKWFKEMSDQEKGDFIEATLPTGVKQMLTAFEQLPPEKRQRAITDSVRRLKEARDDPANGGRGPNGEAPPPLSPELEKRAAAAGLGAFYSQSSAQTKAELAPLLEEIQRQMESGRHMRPMR